MDIKNNTYSVITIATGKPYYIKLAVNLARSFLYWHPDSNLQFWLVTDQPQLVPREVADAIYIKKIDAQQYGEGFSTKLYLDQFMQTQHTLFVDADCLIYGNLEKVFELLQGQEQGVAAVGNVVTDGEFFCDVKTTIKKLGLAYMPRFIGGIYYLEKTALADKVFSKARELLQDYDQIGLVRLRGKENEEPLLSLAMAFYGLKPLPEDGSIKAERMSYENIKSNLLSGEVELRNPNAFPTWVEVRKSTPLIVHYNGSYTDYYYQREVTRLYLHSLFSSKQLASAIIFPGTLIYLAKNKLKETFRPYYRSLFGFRRLKLLKR